MTGESSSDAPPAAELAGSSICNVGLSAALTERYMRGATGRPITSLFTWQAAALACPGVLDGRSNLLYTASTSAGKTLVAELLLLRRLEEAGKHGKALFVLPLRALVQEKAAYFARLLERTGLTCAAYAAGQGELPMPKKLNLVVCTIEKASMIVQSLANEGRLGELVGVAFDEFHLLGESGRGASLEEEGVRFCERTGALLERRKAQWEPTHAELYLDERQ